MEEENILQKTKSGCKEESCKGNGLGWSHSPGKELASALGCCLLVSDGVPKLYLLTSLNLESCFTLGLRY